jgi:[lysine-biosynthesis-protein LysW]---L-2-aminoadipate ligase
VISPRSAQTQASLYVLGSSATETNRALVAALRRGGARARLAGPADLSSLARPGDRVLARLDVLPTLDGVEPGIWELSRLEHRGVEILNRPTTLLACHDKLSTAIHLGRRGVTHPRTLHVGEGSDLGRLELPVVVKPRFGSWGRDVRLCESASELRQCLAELRSRPWFGRQGVLVQELIEPCGHDLRLIVAGEEIVGAIERIAAPGEWRTNVALGGTRRACDPPPAARALALGAASAVGGDVVGVDLLPTPEGGYAAIEVNGAVDFTAEYGLDGLDPFDEVTRALLESPVEAVAVG